jgi:flagellar FliL protein
MAEDLEEDFDEGEGSEELPESPRRKLPIKKILIVVLPILLIAGAGAGLYFTGVLDSLMGKGKPAEQAEVKVDGPKVLGPAAFMDLPEMLVNLQSSGRKQSFLKIRVAIELEAPTDEPKVALVMPRIVDSFQVYLRELRVEDLQGAAGMHLLREELLTRVQASAKPVKVNDVLFREMLVQ